MARELPTDYHTSRRRSNPIPSGPPPRRASTGRRDTGHFDPRTPEHRGRLETPIRPARRKRRRSLSPTGPPRLRSASPSGPPPLKRSRPLPSGTNQPGIADPTACPEKAVLVAWLEVSKPVFTLDYSNNADYAAKDETSPVRASLSPDATGHINLAAHKIQLGKLKLEQQREIEQYARCKDGSLGWQPLPWDTCVDVRDGRVILVRYVGVKRLPKWERYAPFCVGE